MSYASRVRKELRSFKAQESSLWSRVVQHTKDYTSILRLIESDLEIIERRQERAGMYPTLVDHARCSFLQVEVEGETFVLYVKHVCGAPYGASWQNSVMAFCTSNPDLNSETGQGTTHIVALTEEAHKKLLDALAK